MSVLYYNYKHIDNKYFNSNVNDNNLFGIIKSNKVEK